MNIVSVSFSNQNLADLERLKSGFNLANSSETLRVCLQFALEKLGEETDFGGNKTAVLVLRHSHETERFVSDAKHAFQSLVKSQNHFCSSPSECVDLFLLVGSAEQIKKMRNRLVAHKGIRKTSLVVL